VGQENYADVVMRLAVVEQEARYLAMGKDWSWLTVAWGQELRQSGDDLRGFSFSQKSNGWLLTVRLIRDGQPQVVFINRLYPSDCVSKLRKKWLDGTLSFFPDRYA
jgi:hypothetical protein